MFRKECRKLAMKVMIRYKWPFQRDMLIEPAITCVNIFSRQAMQRSLLERLLVPREPSEIYTGVY